MRKSFLSAIAVASSLLVTATAQAEWQPNRPVEFVASAGAGGGTDIFARVVQSAINKNKLMEKPIIVTNKGGGSGAEAFIYAKTNAKDPHKVYFGTQDVYVLPIASKLSYGLKDLTPVISMLYDPFLLWVNPSSGITDPKAFIAKAKTGNLKVGGAKAKEADETLVSLIQRAGGVSMTYIPYKSGSEAAVQLAGGHIDANVNNPSESVEQWRGGMQKPLCVFSPIRLPGKVPVADGASWSSIPTCEESGLAIKSFQQPRTIWLGANVPADVVAFYADLFKKVTETPEWKAYIDRASQIPTVMVGAEFSKFIERDQAHYTEIYERNGWAVK